LTFCSRESHVYNMCEHVIPGELAGNEADVHNTGEHLLPDKPTISFACGTSRLRIPANRV